MQGIDTSIEFGDTDEESEEADTIQEQRADEIWGDVMGALDSIGD